MTKPVLVEEWSDCPTCGTSVKQLVEYRVASNAAIQVGRTIKLHRKGHPMREVLVVRAERIGDEFRLEVAPYHIRIDPS